MAHRLLLHLRRQSSRHVACITRGRSSASHGVVRVGTISLLHSNALLSAAVVEHALPEPTREGNAFPPKIEKIVQDISQLTLLETSQLNELLKTTLNIPDMPMMPMGSIPMATGAPAEDDSDTKVEEQTEFTVRLVNFTADSKIKLIKEVKILMEGMNLVQSKKFVEGVPQVIKSDVSKEEAGTLKATLEAAGGVVEIE